MDSATLDLSPMTMTIRVTGTVRRELIKTLRTAKDAIKVYCEVAA